MDLENGFTASLIRTINQNIPIKSSRTQQSRIQNFRSIGCSQKYHANVGIKAIHLHQ